MRGMTLIAQRLIHDHITRIGGIKEVIVSKELILSCSQARRKYDQYLEEERRKKKSGEELGKRKRTLDLLDKLKAKRGRLSSSIEHLQKSEVTLYNKAEATGKVSFVVEANSIRKGREQKQTELKGLESEISEVVKTLST